MVLYKHPTENNNMLRNISLTRPILLETDTYICARVLSHICKLSIFMSCFNLKSEYFIYYFIFVLIFCLIYLYVYSSFLMFILIILQICTYMLLNDFQHFFNPIVCLLDSFFIFLPNNLL